MDLGKHTTERDRSRYFMQDTQMKIYVVDLLLIGDAKDFYGI